jgi:hypothetical protein
MIDIADGEKKKSPKFNAGPTEEEDNAVNIATSTVMKEFGGWDNI